MTTGVDVDPDDISTNPSNGPSFTDVVTNRASRRSVLAGGMAGAAAFLSTDLLGRAREDLEPRQGRGPARLRSKIRG